MEPRRIKIHQPPIASTMRNRIRPIVKQAESSPESADVHFAVVVAPAAHVFSPIRAQIVISLRQLAGTTPFRAGHNKILPERPAEPVIHARMAPEVSILYGKQQRLRISEVLWKVPEPKADEFVEMNGR